MFGRKALAYGTGLIALFIIAGHGSNMGRLFTSGANGGSKVIKTLQGR